MKKILILIVMVAATAGLWSCGGLRTVSDAERGEISWALFCAARGYDPGADAPRQYNEYLDGWCGSTEEEEAFIAAGIRPW